MPNILVVDDNHDIADSLALGLRIDGHTVSVAYDGAAGLLEGLRCAPHAAVLDLGLPKLDGCELARALRATYGAALILIACTGYADAPMRQRIADAGFNRTFTKPVAMETLLDAISLCDARRRIALA
jgi:DNA-binding response OmpR family regulator